MAYTNGFFTAHPHMHNQTALISNFGIQKADLKMFDYEIALRLCGFFVGRRFHRSGQILKYYAGTTLIG
jgi:hypothetical protein